MSYGLGTGHVLVTDAGGDIEPGDYLQTSPVKGCAEKQPDDVLHNYTVGKATERVDWTRIAGKKGQPKKKLIACTYHAS